MTKATHNGTCQLCGRVHAYNESRGLAKHGYTVEWGYFSGTCHGSGRQPLEIDRSVLDSTLQAWAERAAAWRAVKANDVQKAIVRVSGRYGRPEIMHGVEFAAFVELHAAGRLSYIYGSADLNRAWTLAQEDTERELHREADHLQAHIEAMRALADRTHGQPLPLRIDPEIDTERHVGYHSNQRDAYREAAKFPKADGWKTRVVRRGRYVKMTATRARRAGVSA